MAGKPWNEGEIRETIRAYFDLLDNQQADPSTNKARIYARLAEKFPERTEKAFELKFQNISAILYEQNLPYADGLRPRRNYQLLLKLLVLHHLNRTDRPMVAPKDFLIRQLRRLWDRGYLPVKGKGAGRYGLTRVCVLNCVSATS